MNGTILGLAGLAALVPVSRLLGRRRWQARTRALLHDLDAASVGPATTRVDLAALDTLPPPVARYLRQVLPEGAACIRAVEAAHRGTFNLSADGERWCPFRSRQRVVTQRPGFVWDGRISVFPGLAVHVHDAYVAGEGILQPAVAGLIPLASLRDRAEVARGELMRFLAEAVWYPTVLLPGQGVDWEAVDDDRVARATLVDGAVSVTLDVRFDPDGLVEVVRAAQRGRTVEGHVMPTPWECRVWDWRRHDGFLVPVTGEVAWLLPRRRLAYWRGTLTALRYETAASN